MLRENDHVLLGLSGGKDSLALAWHLLRKSKSGRYPLPFTVEALHIRTDFAGDPAGVDGKDFLEEVRSWGLKTTVVDIPVRKRVREGFRLNCWWCSTQRRLELFRFAQNAGADKIALGHHLDDILETFLMNMSTRGELSTMLPNMRYDKYPQTIIRPLAWTHEEEIRRFVGDLGLESFTCSCPWGERSHRKTARRALEELCGGHAGARDAMFRALSNPVGRYLPLNSQARDGGTAPD